MPSLRRKRIDVPRVEGHLPVDWLDTALPPTRWQRWSERWIDLPATLLVGLIVVATLIPHLSIAIPTPSVSLPATDFSLAGDTDDGRGDGAGEVAARATPAATPRLAPAPLSPSAVVAASPVPSGTTVAATPAVAALSSSTTDPAGLGDVRPNELGGVPIIMYHAFTTNPEYIDEWTLTLDQFREQLDWFRENDFVMVGVQSMIDGRFDVPAGKTPIILTFDDGTAGQFGLQAAPGGGYKLKPDTAVGVLEAYAEAYPKFTGPAFFGIHPWNCFASDDDPSTCEERLTWLVDHGYEVGNHTADHVELTDVSDAFFTNSIAAMIEWINERVPEGPGNLSHALVMPFGAYPDPDLHPEQRAWLAEGFWYEGEPVNLDVVFAVSGGPAIPLYSLEADPSYTYRIASYPEILEPWQDSLLSGDAHLFISDGDPDTVTIPADQLANLDEVWAAEHGLEVRT